MAGSSGTPVEVTGELYFTDVTVDERDELEVREYLCFSCNSMSWMVAHSETHEMKTVQFMVCMALPLNSMVLIGQIMQVQITVHGTGVEIDAFRRWLRKDGAEPVVKHVQQFLDDLNHQARSGQVS
jgi:hypothetical protein